MKKYENLTAHVQFFIPIIEILRKLGGSALLPELKDALISFMEKASRRFNSLMEIRWFSYLSRSNLTSSKR